MADRYLLESGSPDGYLLEDGTGVLLLETGVFWDPISGFNKYAGLTLTNSNLTSTPDGGGTWETVRANLPTAVSSFRFEVALVTGSTPTNIAVGIDDGTTSLAAFNNVPGSANSNGVQLELTSTGWRVLRGGSVVQGPFVSPAAASGQIVTVVVDKAAQTVAFLVNGTQIGVNETSVSFTNWYADVSGKDAATSAGIGNFSGPFSYGTGSAYDGTVSGATVALTGQSLTGAVGSLLAAAALALSGQALTTGQGSVLQGAPITGQSVTVAQGSVSPNVSIALTGQSLSVGQGIVLQGAPITGQSASVAQGTAVPGPSIALTGQSLTASRGSVTPTNAEALSGQSLALGQGTLTPGIAEALTGQAIIVARGSIVAAPSITLSGQGTTAARGSVGPTTSAPIADQSLTVARGTVTASTGGNVTAALTGQALSAAIGSLVPTTTRALSGQALTTAQNSLLPAYALVIGGQSLTTSTGAVSVYDPDVTAGLTGLSLSIALGSTYGTTSDEHFKFWRQPTLIGRRINPGRSR